MRASAKSSLGEVAVHAQDLIPLREVVLLQPDTHVSNALILAVLSASSEDVVDREKLQTSFTATSTSTVPIMRENLSFDSLQSLAITSPRSIPMSLTIRIARLLNGMCATLGQAQTGLLPLHGCRFAPAHDVGRKGSFLLLQVLNTFHRVQQPGAHDTTQPTMSRLPLVPRRASFWSLLRSRRDHPLRRMLAVCRFCCDRN